MKRAFLHCNNLIKVCVKDGTILIANLSNIGNTFCELAIISNKVKIKLKSSSLI